MKTKKYISSKATKNGGKLPIIQKVLFAMAAGIFTFFLSKFGIEVEMGDVKINLPWSLLFSIMVSLGYGWRYGLIAGVFGGALYPFLLWEINGFANIMNASLLFLLFFMIGKAKEMENDRPSVANRSNVWASLCVFMLIMALSYYFLFNPLLSLNPPFWTSTTMYSLPQATIISFIIKDCVNVMFLVLTASALLSIPYIRQFMVLPVNSAMRFNFQIFFLSILTAIVVWGVFVVMDIALIKESQAISRSHYTLALKVLLASGAIVSIFLMRFSEKRLVAELLLEESKKRLKKAQEIGHVGSWEYDVHTRNLFWSDEVYRICGFEPLEVEPSFE